MSPQDRQDVDRINRLLWFAFFVFIFWAVIAISHIKPWMFANPPPEACRPAGQRATPQTQHLQPCPAVERRAKETTA